MDVLQLIDKADDKVPAAAPAGVRLKATSDVTTPHGRHAIAVAARIDPNGRRHERSRCNNGRVERHVLLRLTFGEAECPQAVTVVRVQRLADHGQRPAATAPQGLRRRLLMTKVALADDRQDLAPSSMDTGRRPGMASGYDRVFADKTLASASPRTSDFVRRLRAIAVIDVVDYSRMMASEEALTHARVNALFAAVVEPAIEKHSGRRIERAGDGLIVLFESSTDAVRCALAIQRGTEDHSSIVKPEHRLRMRIGINVGDIIIDGDEIAGDDVNIAVRLQSLAEPGTVCISAAVRSQLHEGLDSTCEDLGDVMLKNIGRPIRVYQVRRRDHATARSSMMQLAWWRRLLVHRRPFVLVALVLAAMGAMLHVMWLGLIQRPKLEPLQMSVVVLPFTGREVERREQARARMTWPLTSLRGD